jgi:hypothetical protein
MTGNQVNYLNIGLIFVALVVAFKLPFELFLFSYAVLGPLHYLTEIAWLKKQNFFTKGRRDWIILAILCFLYFSFYMINLGSTWEPTQPMYVSLLGENYKETVSQMTQFTTHFIFVAFVISLSMVLLKKWQHKVILGGGALILAWLIADWSFYAVAFSIFLPTLVHVSLFTGAFMLYGALKSKSTSGVITFAIFVVACIICFTANVNTDYIITEETFHTYWSTSFQYLNLEILGFTSIPLGGQASIEAVFRSEFGLAIQRFVAFAYTYHYFNWFSKTTVIKWHKVPVLWLVSIGVIWMLSLGLYWYNYRIGLLALLFLSMLHVFLEFPLNYQSFIGIGKEIGARFKAGDAASEKAAAIIKGKKR